MDRDGCAPPGTRLDTAGRWDKAGKSEQVVALGIVQPQSAGDGGEHGLGDVRIRPRSRQVQVRTEGALGVLESVVLHARRG
ncbi:hypothetical protein ASD08_46605 [Streptomyces sp. Root369]|nr:hypothetical protein ASD08_46605 [Streptomyces sp. Root369]